MKESYVAISKMFYNLRNELDTEITIHLKPNWKIPPIDKNSSFGEQIKHYRRLANIKQNDLCAKVGCDRGVLSHLENRRIKLTYIKYLKKIIEELNIEDKLIINDDYIDFLLNNPIKTIKDFRDEKNYSVSDLAKLSGIHNAVIGRWENGEERITRKSFEKLKKCMNF